MYVYACEFSGSKHMNARRTGTLPRRCCSATRLVPASLANYASGGVLPAEAVCYARLAACPIIWSTIATRLGVLSPNITMSGKKGSCSQKSGISANNVNNKTLALSFCHSHNPCCLRLRPRPRFQQPCSQRLEQILRNSLI